MSLEFRSPGPRSEVAGTLPPRETTAPGRPVLLLSGRSDEAREFAERSLLHLQQQAAEERSDSGVALSMLGKSVGEAARTFTALWEAEAREHGEREGEDGSFDLYDMAVRADAAGRTNDAILILMVMAGTDEGEQYGFLGLAVIAARQGRMDDALALVARCMSAGDRHPRALSITGIGELERGNKPAAQTYLAAATRVARRRPEFRMELQIAQRALLLMHLG